MVGFLHKQPGAHDCIPAPPALASCNQAPCVAENARGSVGSDAPQPVFEVDNSSLLRMVQKNGRHLLNLLSADGLAGRQALGREQLVLEESSQVASVWPIRRSSHSFEVVVVIVQYISPRKLPHYGLGKAPSMPQLWTP